MTNKELLQEVLDNQRKLAEDNLTLAGKLSNFMNEQQQWNKRLEFFIEGDKNTGTKGVIQQQRETNSRLDKIEDTLKVTSGKIVGFFFAVTTIGSLVYKAIQYLTK